MERSEKVDLYKNGLLKREIVYITFMAAGETDLSLLPEPVTMTEKLMYKQCKEKVQHILDVAKVKPVDSKHPDGYESAVKSTQKPEEPDKETEKEEPKKKTSVRRATKK